MSRKSPWILLGLLALGWGRLSYWKAGQEEAQALCHSLAFAPSSMKSLSFSGSLERGSFGRGELTSPSWKGRSFAGRVLLHFFPEGLEFGRELSVSGPFRCTLPLRNPGDGEDGWRTFQAPRFSLYRNPRARLEKPGTSFTARVRAFWLRHLESKFARYPGLLGFEWALWTGDASRLPENLRKFYLEGGVLQILALSGQHVIGMTLVGSLLLNLSFSLWMRLGGKAPGAWGFWSHRLLALGGAWFLWVTSLGSGPMVRTLAVFFLHAVLQWRRFQISPLQKIASLVAVQIVWQPSLLGNPSYLLSASITALTGQSFFQTNYRERVKNYFLTATWSPWLVAPLSAFFFAKVSLLGPFYQVLLAWVWDLFLIPVGFLLPFLGGDWLFTWAEDGWQWFVRGHEFLERTMGSHYLSVVRPTFAELILLETLLVLLAVRRKAKRFP